MFSWFWILEIKWVFQPEMHILTSFTHPHVVSNLYAFVSSAEYFFLSHTDIHCMEKTGFKKKYLHIHIYSRAIFFESEDFVWLCHTAAHNLHGLLLRNLASRFLRICNWWMNSPFKVNYLFKTNSYITYLPEKIYIFLTKYRMYIIHKNTLKKIKKVNLT